MEALIEAARDPAYPASAVLVASNRPEAPGLARARAHGLEASAIDHTLYGKNREAFERDLDGVLRAWDIDFIALAGFMRVLTPFFVTRWAGRMVNIHPSLLPKYRGVDTHARALATGDAQHGCSVHWVTPGVDEGAVIGQAILDTLPGDTPDTLAARVLKAEHLLYPRALAAAITGRPMDLREPNHIVDGVRIRLR
jgi:phosphoribosylglycinamide formyltransferase-1